MVTIPSICLPIKSDDKRKTITKKYNWWRHARVDSCFFPLEEGEAQEVLGTRGLENVDLTKITQFGCFQK